MPLVTAEGLVPDRWRRASKATPLTDGVALLLPLARLDEALAAGVDPVGVEVSADTHLGLLVRRLHSIALIAIRFDSFTGDRGFALARELRQLGFEGRLRATGHAVGDDLGVLAACGIDEMAVDPVVASRRPELSLRRRGAEVRGSARRRVARERVSEALAAL